MHKSDTEGIRPRAIVLRSLIDAVTWDDVVEQILRLGAQRVSSYVCLCNVHSVVSAQQDLDFQLVINGADLAVPDGAPVAWAMRRLGRRLQARIDGPGLMLRVCEQAAGQDLSIFLYGSTEHTLAKLSDRLKKNCPGIQIVGAYSPPFRSLSEEEDEQITARINSSNTGIVFVGLGCPKQEKWMAMHRGRIHAVMIGVGAAFDYHAGVLKRAPLWMQHYGLEWLHRLCMEPHRLSKRYLFTNGLYILALSLQLLRRAVASVKVGRRENSA